MLARLVAVLVTEMDLDPGDAFAEAVEGTRNRSFDGILESLSPFDMVVGVDLDLHEGAMIVLAAMLARDTAKTAPGR